MKENAPVMYRVVSMGSGENISIVSRKMGCCKVLVFLCYSELLKLFSVFPLEPSSCISLLIPVWIIHKWMWEWKITAPIDWARAKTSFKKYITISRIVARLSNYSYVSIWGFSLCPAQVGWWPKEIFPSHDTGKPTDFSRCESNQDTVISYPLTH